MDGSDMQIPGLRLMEGGIPLQGNLHYVSSNYVESKLYFAD